MDTHYTWQDVLQDISASSQAKNRGKERMVGGVEWWRGGGGHVTA